jgi:hypothetical protein
MLRNFELMSQVFGLVMFTFISAGAFAQTPHQIQERQQAEERALQRDAAARDQQQHEAQVEQMRAIDRQQAEEQREQSARAAQAQAVAAQEQLYILQQQALQKQRAERESQDGNQGSAAQSPAGAPAGQVNQSSPQQPQPSDAPRWSFRNMSNEEKAGIAGLGVVLVALAFAAGIIPARFTPRWLGRLGFRHE